MEIAKKIDPRNVLIDENDSADTNAQPIDPKFQLQDDVSRLSNIKSDALSPASFDEKDDIGPVEVSKDHLDDLINEIEIISARKSPKETEFVNLKSSETK